jgi:hypothetical protein
MTTRTEGHVGRQRLYWCKVNDNAVPCTKEPSDNNRTAIVGHTPELRDRQLSGLHTVTRGGHCATAMTTTLAA